MNEQRRVCGTAVILVVVLWTAGSVERVSAAEQVRLRIRDAAGMRRRGFPVHARLKLAKPVGRDTKFRLLDRGKPIQAQFRPDGEGSTSSAWHLDFVAHLSPGEARELVVEHGPDVEAFPERQRGHRLTKTADSFVIANEPYLSWTVPRDFRGFLTSMNFRPAEHLKPSSGLVIRDREGRVHTLGGPGTKATVVRDRHTHDGIAIQRNEENRGALGRE